MLNMLKLNKSMTQQIRAKNDGTLTHRESLIRSIWLYMYLTLIGTRDGTTIRAQSIVFNQSGVSSNPRPPAWKWSGKDQDNGQKSSRAEVFVKSELRVRLLECFSFLLQFPAFPPSTTENFNTRRITWKLNPWSIFPENKLNRLRKFKKTREKDNDL